MIRLPLKKTGKEVKKKACSASGNTFRKSNQRLRDLAEKKEGVDGNKKVLHNLISLVLTNKTICSEAENTKWSEVSQDASIAKWVRKNTDL
ncbi:MAG: hypothetical protein Q7T62_02750 [Undibacterium sp.]|nr:hypothetical protein [Undibacterium sp.]